MAKLVCTFVILLTQKAIKINVNISFTMKNMLTGISLELFDFGPKKKK